MNSRPRRFQEHGNVAVIFAIGAVLILGAAGLAIDYAFWNSDRAELQESADAAALAGAAELGRGGHKAAARAEARALQFIDANLTDRQIKAVMRSVVVDEANDRITATLTMPARRSLSALVVKRDPEIAVRAVSAAISIETACVFALNPTASKAMHVNGSAILEGTNCGIQASSTASDALANSGTIKASNICVAGDYTGSGYTPTPTTSCPVNGDPFASLAVPAAGACTETGLSINASRSLSPGVYCGGISVSGGATVVQLAAGEYYFVDGPLKVSGGASLLGDNVVFILSGTASMDISGQGEVVTTPPLTGGLTGFSVIQDRGAPLGGVSKVSGEGRFEFPGIIYLPRQALDIAGRASGNLNTPSYAAVIADTIKISGQGDLRVTADTSVFSASAAQKLTTVNTRLIE